MSQTVDTNILVYASNEDSPQHKRARALLDYLHAGPTLVVFFWPTILGYLRIATHSSIFPQPLGPQEAVDNVTRLLAPSHIHAEGEAPGFWPAYQQVAAPTKPRGNLVPDTHLVTLMHQHGVSKIWTADRDFRKFDGIKALDPFGDRYAAGFD